MTMQCYHHGHLIEQRWPFGPWVYADDGTPMEAIRPCPRCGRPPTPEGHDACLGTLPGIRSACCGHGVTEPILLSEAKT